MRFRLIFILIFSLCSAGLAFPPKAALVDDKLPGMDPQATAAIADAVRAAGYEVVSLTAEKICDRKTGLPSNYDMLVVPNGTALPLESVEAVSTFLEAGGDAIVCGLPMWSAGVVKFNGKWLSRADRQSLLRQVRPQRVLVDFTKEDLSHWQRSSNVAQPKATWNIEGDALHMVIPALSGWDTFARGMPGTFDNGMSITCFRAKGGPKTKNLLVEWQEKDSSRWIATVDLTPGWKDYTLTPADFHPWTPPPGRGGPRDRLRVENVERFTIGLGISHGSTAGAHEYWFEGLGVAPNPAGEAVGEVPIPHLETLAPAYLFHPISGNVFLSRPIGPAPDSAFRIKPPADLIGMHPRPGTSGYDKNRPWIWKPLLRASEGREFRGTIASLVVNLRGRTRGAAWAAFTPDDPAFYKQRGITGLIEHAARTIRRGVYLQEGGSAHYTVLAGQKIKLGARVYRSSSQQVGRFTVRIAVVSRPESKVVYQREWPLKIEPGATVHVEDEWSPDRWPDGGFRVVTDLTEDGSAVDRIEHELHVWRPAEQPAFVQARTGGFWLNGAPWKAHGINYMPSSGVGQANQPIFEYWLGGAAYDPEVIDRDLRRIKAMGLNAVSVFLYHQSLHEMNALDLLRRCRDLGLYVNLSLRPGTPMDFQWDKMREMIEVLQLSKNETVFAYDLAWEPSHFGHAHQRQYAGAWKQWVLKRYGSIEAATKVWQVAAPSENGDFSVPPAGQLVQDGPWKKQVADYRLFLDEMLGEKYAEARRLVKSIDPNHAVSFRMQHAGDPTINNPGLLPYDFWGLRNAVDIWEPEAYGRIGDWDRVKAGHFTAAYARLCDAEKPVMWSEMGVSVWDGGKSAVTAEKLEFAAKYYQDFYRMMIESGADGVFYWWYPGGYRVNEKSDFGIINADGTDRPVTKVIRENAEKFLSAPKPGRTNHWIEVDRDADSRGLYGMYEKVRQEYWKAIAGGKVPGLKWKREPGSE